MATFLILHRIGPESTDLEIAGIIDGKKQDQSEEAISEAMTKGEGEYIAVPFDEDIILRKEARSQITLVDPEPEPEISPKPSPASVEEPEPVPKPET